MIPFYSKRNQVYPSIRDGECVVEKHFCDLADWEHERKVFEILKGKISIPRVMQCEPGMLITSYLPYPSFLAVLEEQERNGFSAEPWIALSDWLRKCSCVAGILPSDVNLRNFLWDAENQVVYGLDLESYTAIPLCVCGASLTVMLMSYDPEDTLVKAAAAEVLTSQLSISREDVCFARSELDARRGAGKHNRAEMSAIVLAGGKSRRMGCNKAELLLLGRTLLQHQIDKLQMLGIKDIIVSGESEQNIPHVRFVQDEYMDRGPLGGLHACLKQAKNPQCLVLGVDIPLIPVSTLSQMMRTHVAGVSILRHSDGEEPLIGVYDSDTHRLIDQLISDGGAPVRALRNMISWQHFDYLGPKELLGNCNTPDEFSAVRGLAAQFEAHGIKL